MCVPASKPAWTSIASRLASFFWAIGMNFFMEIARVRTVWAKLMAEEFDRRTRVRSRSAAHCRSTSGWSLAAQSVFNNVRHLRGGHGRYARPYPVAAHQCAGRGAGAADDFSARIARNTQLMLQMESGTTRIMYSLGHGFYVERLTHDLAARALDIEEVKFGGMAKAIEAGIPKRMIEQAATATQGRIVRAARPSSAIRRTAMPTSPSSKSTTAPSELPAARLERLNPSAR